MVAHTKVIGGPRIFLEKERKVERGGKRETHGIHHNASNGAVYPPVTPEKEEVFYVFATM